MSFICSIKERHWPYAVGIRERKVVSYVPERQAEAVPGWVFLGTVSSLDFIFNGV